MLFELVAVIVAGIAAAGVVLVARRVAPALPRWSMPAAAGLAMLAASISLEYSWFGRTAASLPSGVAVASVHENRAPWRPWTYVEPYVDRFVAVDRAGMLTHDAAEGQRIVSLYLFARWVPARRVRAVFDCEAGRRADLLTGDELSSDGAVAEAAWVDTGIDDPVTRTACGVG